MDNASFLLEFLSSPIMQIHRQLLSLTLLSLASGRLSAQQAAPSSILIHDGCAAADRNLTQGSTQVLIPGPGIATAGAVQAPATVRYSEFALTLTPSNPYHSLVHYGGIPARAGLTLMVRVIPTWQNGQTLGAHIGFSDSPSELGRFVRGAMRFGTSAIYGGQVGEIVMSQLSGNQDNGIRFGSASAFNAGEEIGLAVQYESLSHQTYWAQGGKFASFGCTLGSENWYQLGETFANLSGTTVYPIVAAQNSGSMIIKDVQVLSSWTPSSDHQMTDFDFDKIGLHVPSMARDPASGLAVVAWNNSTTHVSADSMIRAAVKTADGKWTSSQTIMSAPGGNAINQINSLSVVGNKMWLVYFSAPSVSDGGTLYRREVNVEINGHISLGDEVLLSGLETGEHKLNFSPILALPGGRLLLPYHNSASSIPYTSHVGISDDGGVTWSPVQLSPSMPSGTTWLVEPSLILEGDGAVGCYMRSTARVAYYSRSTNGGQSWSFPRPIAQISQPGGNGSRMQTLRLTDGQMLLIGNNNKEFRRNLTIWSLGDHGIVRGSAFLGDFNPQSGSSSTILQYPALLEDGEKLIYAYSMATPGRGTSIHLHARIWAGTPPNAVTENATGTVFNASTLNGTVNPNGLPTTIRFQYGTTTAYGNSTAALEADNGTTATSFGAPVTGLNSGTTYHFQVVAVNSNGTSYGLNQTFTTPTPTSPLAETNPAEIPGNIYGASLTLNKSVPGSITLNHGIFPSDRTFDVQASPDLAQDSWTTIVTNIGNLPASYTLFGIHLATGTTAAGYEFITITDGRTPAPPRQFYRLTATPSGNSN